MLFTSRFFENTLYVTKCHCSSNAHLGSLPTAWSGRWLSRITIVILAFKYADATLLPIYQAPPEMRTFIPGISPPQFEVVTAFL